MDNASGAEGRGRRVETEEELLFPSDGHFSRVVPLSEAGEEVALISEAGADVAPPAAASAPDESEESDDAVTLVPARVSRAALHARTPRPKKYAGQSWGFMAAVLAISIVAGVAAGAYMIRSQRPSETFGRDNVEAAAVGGAAEKVPATQPAEQPVPQTPAPAPQAEDDRLAAATTSAAAPSARAASDEADAKSESVSPSTPSAKAPARAADASPRRVVEPEPRAERPARASSEARDLANAPRPTQSDAAPRHAPRPARANAPTPERSLPISSPPPSARPKKVIQWP